jgi:hypothetical protein
MVPGPHIVAVYYPPKCILGPVTSILNTNGGFLSHGVSQIMKVMNDHETLTWGSTILRNPDVYTAESYWVIPGA